MKHPLFDFEKYSLQYYIDVLKEFVITKDKSVLPFPIHNEVLHKSEVRFDVLNCKTRVWANSRGAFHTTCTEGDSSTGNISYNKIMNTSSYNGSGISYIHRPSKGITYKEYTLPSGIRITENRDQKRVSITTSESHTFSTYKMKKHRKNSLNVYRHVDGIEHASLAINLKEEQRDKGTVRYSSITIYEPVTIKDIKHSLCEIHLKQLDNKKVQMRLRSNYTKKDIEHVLELPDASIEHIFDAEKMFLFELMVQGETFVVLDAFRSKVIECLQHAHNHKKTNLIRDVLYKLTKD